MTEGGREKKLVVDLRSRAAAFRLPDEVGHQLEAATPAGWTTHVVAAETDSFGDGAQTPSEESVREVADAEIYFAYGMPKALFHAAKRLRWVHTATAGVASLLFPEMMASDILLTNSSGIYGPPIAEHVLGGVLHFIRGFDFADAQKRQQRWDPTPFSVGGARIRELSELRMLVVGAGGIGAEVASRFGALGAQVVGIRRVPGKGTPAGFARMTGLDALERELPSADVLVLATPLTPETRALLTAPRIALLPDGAIVVNVSRGALVDEPALVAALDSGKLRGAVLDVFQKEPLARESALWHLPNVLHTPHISGVSPRRFWERLNALFLGNWERYRAGEPLRNLVDKHAGY